MVPTAGTPSYYLPVLLPVGPQASPKALNEFREEPVLSVAIDPTDGLVCADKITVFITPKFDGQYYVEVFDMRGVRQATGTNAGPYNLRDGDRRVRKEVTGLRLTPGQDYIVVVYALVRGDDGRFEMTSTSFPVTAKSCTTTPPTPPTTPAP